MMRMQFGNVAIVATEIGVDTWVLEAFQMDNLENLLGAFAIEPVTVRTVGILEAARKMAQAAWRLQR